MKKSYLEKLYFKKKTTESLKKNKKHRFFCGGLCKKACKKYLDSLDVNKTTDNKAFQRNIQPLFSETGTFANKITLEDNELNFCIQNATETLNVTEN